MMFGILSDTQIEALSNPTWVDPMISPFEKTQVREVEGHAAISYGLSSYGYDLRLSGEDFRVFYNGLGLGGLSHVIDPKAFNEGLLAYGIPRTDETGTWFLLSPHSYALAHTIEYIHMPRDVTAVAVGKSTYARCGLIVNTTPLEAGWHGRVTLELANATSLPIKVYANEGICQALFFRGSQPASTSYADREGKYQAQTGLTLPRV